MSPSLLGKRTNSHPPILTKAEIKPFPKKRRAGKRRQQENKFHLGSRMRPQAVPGAWLWAGPGQEFRRAQPCQDYACDISQDLQEESWKLGTLPHGTSACPRSQVACRHACVYHVCVFVCAYGCARTLWGVSFPGSSLAGSASPPPASCACSRPRPSTAPLQPPAPDVCCGRCLAVPWQRQNRMYLWIAAGTSPHSQAALTVSLPKDLLGRTTGVQVGDKWCLYGREAEPVSSSGSVAEEGEDTCAHPSWVPPSPGSLCLLSSALRCHAKEVGWEEGLPGSSWSAGSDQCLLQLLTEGLSVAGPVLRTLYSKEYIISGVFTMCWLHGANLYNTTLRLFSFFKWGDWGTQRLSLLFQATEWVS